MPSFSPQQKMAFHSDDHIGCVKLGKLWVFLPLLVFFTVSVESYGASELFPQPDVYSSSDIPSVAEVRPPVSRWDLSSYPTLVWYAAESDQSKNFDWIGHSSLEPAWCDLKKLNWYVLKIQRFFRKKRPFESLCIVICTAVSVVKQCLVRLWPGVEFCYAGFLQLGEHFYESFCYLFRSLHSLHFKLWSRLSLDFYETSRLQSASRTGLVWGSSPSGLAVLRHL